MDIEERTEKALEKLGPGARVVRRQTKKGKRRPRPISSFVKKKRGVNMSRQEYNQCGKKTRYRSKHEASIAASSAMNARGGRLRVYGPCRFCGGWHITHRARDDGDSGES